MRKPTPGHSPEYRQWAVEKAIASGNISQTSRELRLARSVLMRWCKAYRKNGGTGLKTGPGRPQGRKLSPRELAKWEDLDLLRRKIGEQQVMIDFLSEACRRFGVPLAPNNGDGGKACTPPSKR